MSYFSLILLLIAANGGIDGALRQLTPAPEALAPPFINNFGVRYPTGYSPYKGIGPLNRPPDDFRPIREYGVNETSITEYPHFVKIAAVEGNLLNPNEIELEWENFVRYGVIISNYHVLLSGSMCDDCTFIVIVGGVGKLGQGGSRHKAEPIPYNDDWKSRASFKTLILLRLTTPIEFGVIAQPVQLPDLGDEPESGDGGMLVGPPIYLGGSVLNLSNRTVLNQQDCNKFIKSSIKKWGHQIISPSGTVDNTTEVPVGSFCAVDAPETAMFLASDFSTLFIQSKLAGIGYQEIHVLVDPRGSFDYTFHYGIAYHRDWIKTVTGV